MSHIAKRTIVLGGLSGALLVGTVGVAAAAPGDPVEPPPAPPVANCDPFSAFVCQVPVTINVGPIPVDVGSIFAPPPAAPA